MLDEQLTYDKIATLTDARSLSLGEDYFRSDAVHELNVWENRVTAEVIGTELYTVTLTAEKSGLDYECDCPYHDETGTFCKHCVAVALAYIRDFGGFRTVAVPEDEKPAARKGTRRVGKTVTAEHLRDWLNRQSAAELTAIIWEHAKSDLDWRKRLFLRVAADTQKGVNVPALRKTIENATKSREYPDAKQTRAFLKNVEEVLVTLKELVAIGEGKPVQELALFAVDRVKAVYENSQSAGDAFDDVIQQLIGIHRDATILAPPDPLELAADLYQREISDGYGLWRDTTETYSRALGETGKSEFRRLLFADWDKIPALTKDDGRQYRFDQKRSRVTRMMESLAERENDADLALAILQRDLSNSSQYTAIVQALLKTGRRDDARMWAERAVKEFGAGTNRYLTDFLIEEYKTRGEHGRSLRLLWSRFEDNPAVETYQSLREYTEPLGEWTKWRGDALLLLRKRIAEKPSVPSYRSVSTAANPLIDIYLSEENTDAAWETARTHGTDDEHWKRLAQMREATNPNEALATWRKLFDKEMNRASGYYTDVLWLLAQLRRVYRTLSRDADFGALVADLRVQHKNKRKFIAELNALLG